MDKSSSANIMLPGGVWVLSRRPPEGSPSEILVPIVWICWARWV